MMFHDDLRIVCERIKQLTPLVEKYEVSLASGVDFSKPPHISLLIDMAELSKGLAELLESVLLYGWAAQTDLDGRPSKKPSENMVPGEGFEPPTFGLQNQRQYTCVLTIGSRSTNLGWPS